MYGSDEYRSFSWQVLRQAKKAFYAQTFYGDTTLTAPPFFDDVIRGADSIWGVEDEGPIVVKWTGLNPVDRDLLKPKL